MTLYEFNALSEHYQYDTEFTQGQFIDTVIFNDIKHALYAISMFWVEVEYHAPSNKIIKCTAFLTGHRMDEYSNIPDLF